MIFCVINTLNCVDHGAIANNGVNRNLEICGDFGICTAATGIHHNSFHLTGVGLPVGVGKASFISLAAPFIDNNAPVEQKIAWLATFYMCIPDGTALGYVYGVLERLILIKLRSLDGSLIVSLVCWFK
ncbi:hypothetical protein AHAS_Ahas09G0112300 [Arachis hypogaea]